MIRKLITVLLILSGFLPAALMAQADQDETRPLDIMRLGGNVRLSAPATRDFLGLGGVVEVNELVAKDVLAAGGTVLIASEVMGDVRAAGGRVVIEGTVHGNVAVFGGEIWFAPESNVLGSVVAAGGKVALEGEVVGDLRIWADEVFLDGPVGGRATITIDNAPDLVLGDNAGIAGDFVYRSPTSKADLDVAKVAGAIEHRKLAAPEIPREALIFFRLISLFGLLVVGLVVATLAPKMVRAAARDAIKNPLPHLLWGLGVLALAPLVVAVLALTLIGLPLALIILAFYLVLVYVSQVLFSIVLGIYIIGAIRGRQKEPEFPLLGLLVIGVAVFWLLSGLPVVGLFITLIGIIWGLGIAVKLIANFFKSAEPARLA